MQWPQCQNLQWVIFWASARLPVRIARRSLDSSFPIPLLYCLSHPTTKKKENKNKSTEPSRIRKKIVAIWYVATGSSLSLSIHFRIITSFNRIIFFCDINALFRPSHNATRDHLDKCARFAELAETSDNFSPFSWFCGKFATNFLQMHRLPKFLFYGICI